MQTEAPTERDRLAERVSDLTVLGEHVEGERDLALFRAHEAGVATADLAHRTHLSVSAVDALIAEYARADLTDCDGELDWVQYHDGAIYH